MIRVLNAGGRCFRGAFLHQDFGGFIKALTALGWTSKRGIDGIGIAWAAMRGVAQLDITDRIADTNVHWGLFRIALDSQYIALRMDRNIIYRRNGSRRPSVSDRHSHSSGP